MKIHILGAGDIGGTLGGKWAAQGHEVVFGVRDPQAEKVRNLIAEIGANASAVDISTTVTDADVVIFAIPGRIVAETAGQLSSYINGKILIDATNNMGGPTMHSLNALRQTAPDSPLFRAFSSLGWENFADPVLDGQQVDLFYCGDNGAPQAVVDKLIAEVGLRPVYIGGTEQAYLIDALTRLWFITAMQQGRGRHLAFKMIGG